MSASHSTLTTVVKSILVIGLCALAAVGCSGQTDGTKDASADPDRSAAQALLSRAIAYHDPNAVWASSTIHIEWMGSGDDGSERVAVEFTLQPDRSKFELSGRYRGSTLEYQTDGSTWSATIDGDSTPSPDALEKMRLDREGGMYWRSYYGFLAGLPMKLRDPGARIDPEPIDTTFNGRRVRALRVTYDPEVGTDSWYFYFDPETAALVGCRFNHDEAANDGEYLVLDGVIESGGVRLPRHRRWYVNADDRFLGADEVRSFELTPSGPDPPA